MIIWVIVVVVLVGAGGGFYGFRPKSVPQVRVVTVSFSVRNSDTWDSPSPGGASCTGSDVSAGYGDITDLTAVVASTIGGKVLARTELGDGSVTTKPDPYDPDNPQAYSCDFSADLTLTKGSDGGRDFVIAVGSRGSVQKSWSELGSGVVLNLGDN